MRFLCTAISPFVTRFAITALVNKFHTKNEIKISQYLEKLYEEIELQGRLFDRDRIVTQLHWGGGTPTLLSEEQSQGLMGKLSEHFTLSRQSGRDFSIEVDPRTATEVKLTLLRKIGFNRLSFGIQDFDPRVQKAINRIQSEVGIIEVFELSRRLGFKSINVDLIYGLPFQTTSSFAQTLEKLIVLRPDRVAIYHYTHMPTLFPAQRKIDTNTLPTAEEGLELLLEATCCLTEAGFEYLGLDHFVLKTDGLFLAKKERTLQRNFQGYSSHAGLDLVGLGVSAISCIRGELYTQNYKTLDGYYDAVERGNLPIQRGILLSKDDLIRREVIHSLMCYCQIHFPVIEHRHKISFNTYFASEIEMLHDFQRDGLVKILDKVMAVMPLGQFFLRNICRIFDAYTPHLNFTKPRV